MYLDTSVLNALCRILVGNCRSQALYPCIITRLHHNETQMFFMRAFFKRATQDMCYF